MTGTGVQLQDISCPPGSVCQSCHATVTLATTFTQNSHCRNNAACRVATFARHPSLGSAFISSQTFDFEALKHLSINPHEVTPVNWALLEAAMLRARQEVLHMRGVTITLHSVVKHYLPTPAMYNTIPQGLNHLIMVLITVCCSEADCETVASVLERMHKQRYTMINAGPLITEATRKLIASNHSFATSVYLRTPGNTVVSKAIKSAKEGSDFKLQARRKGILEIR